MLDTDQRSRLLQLYPALAELPGLELDPLLAQAMVVPLPAGTVIFDENQPCQGFPMLLSGSIRVIKASPNGRELQLYRVEPGESCILTSSCLLGHTRYQARGIVDQALEMVLLPAPSFHKLLGSNWTSAWLRCWSPSHPRCAPRTRHWPTNWAVPARWSAVCSRALPSKAGSGWRARKSKLLTRNL